MTASKYLFLRLAIYFGYARKNVRVGEVSSESMLLKEAQTFLGEAIWQKVDQIEEISMEYWNLKKLNQDFQRISGEIQQFQNKLNENQEIRAVVLESVHTPIKELAKQRVEIISKMDQLTRIRDRISNKASEAQRKLKGLNVTLEVLRGEPDKATEISRTTERLEELKVAMEAIQREKLANAQDMAALGSELRDIEEEIADQKIHGRSKVIESSQGIGDANQQISLRRAELNIISTQMRQLYLEIGRFMSRHSKTDPECRKVCRELAGLIDVMAALQRSIHYNTRLAELS
ncbi:MAG: hypothetical protein RL346_1237 [Verrucomicrobiota bacterium]|jgi:chromosome segregation ATPase